MYVLIVVLVFALKYEGIDLLVFKKLFECIGASTVKEILQIEPTGQYSRKVWFLYEWLMDEKLDIPDLAIKKAVPLIDEKLQYAIKGVSSPRHKIINNLPGTLNYCPIIRKTEKIEKYIQSGYRYHVAETDSQVVGVVAVRDNVHLFHLFVAEQYQRRGIATQLWKVAKTVCLNEGNPGEFTVNSSSFARDVYEKLGFISCSDPQEIDGILFYPMKLKLTGKT